MNLRIQNKLEKNNAMVRHDLEANHNFNFKDSKMVVNIQNKKHRKIVESSIMSNSNTGFCFVLFQFIFLLSQISVKKLQNPLFETV